MQKTVALNAKQSTNQANVGNFTHSLPVNETILFEDVEGETGMCWRNLFRAENALAQQLLSLPVGSVAVHEAERVGHFLWPQRNEPSKLALYNFLVEDFPDHLDESLSRFDIDPSYIDTEEADLIRLANACNQPLSEFMVVQVAPSKIALSLEISYAFNVNNEKSASASLPELLNTRKQATLDDAQVMLNSATKMLSRFAGTQIAATEVSRIQDAANQAQHAAAILNQLVGILLAEADAGQ